MSGLGLRIGVVDCENMVWALADCPAPDFLGWTVFSFAHIHTARDVRRCLGRVTGMPPRGVRAAQGPGRSWNAVEERMSDRRFFADHLYKLGSGVAVFLAGTTGTTGTTGTGIVQADVVRPTTSFSGRVSTTS